MIFWQASICTVHLTQITRYYFIYIMTLFVISGIFFILSASYSSNFSIINKNFKRNYLRYSYDENAKLKTSIHENNNIDHRLLLDKISTLEIFIHLFMIVNISIAVASILVNKHVNNSSNKTINNLYLLSLILYVITYIITPYNPLYARYLTSLTFISFNTILCVDMNYK